MNLAIKNGLLLDRWTKEVSVMLEKKTNDISVRKLRAILLLEADFNAANKIIINTRLISQIEQCNEIPREIVEGCHSQSAIQLAVNKRLLVDIVN